MRRPVLAVVLVPLLVLAGCTTTAPAPGPTSTATPPPEPEAPTGPTPYLDLGCVDLVPGELAHGALTDPVELMPIAEYRELSWFDVPRGSAVRQLRGLTCEWSNGVEQADDVQLADYRGIYVSVLPGAVDEWPKFAPYLEAGATDAAWCTPAADHHLGITTCQYDGLVGDAWLHVELSGVAGDDPRVALAGVSGAVTQALSNATAAEPWTAPDSDLAISFDCEELTLAADGFYDSPGSTFDGGGGWSQEASSWSLAGVLGTACSREYDTDGHVEISGLAGAGWAWQQVIDAGAMPGATSMEVTGLVGDDRAWMVCADEDRCVAHLVIGGGWVRVGVVAAESDPQAIARTLADLVAARVRA